MSDLTKLEAGKTYVFKDEDAKEAWLSRYSCNKQQYDLFYNNGFTIEYVYKGIQGETGQRIVIGSDELQYFKLKEDETMQQHKHIRPEDEVTITTTYGELAKVYLLLANSNGICGFTTFTECQRIFDDEDSVKLEQVYFKFNVDDYCGIESEWLKILFPEPTPVESPTQRKARELREQAELLLAKAKELEEVM